VSTSRRRRRDDGRHGTILPVPHGGKDLLEVELGPLLRALEERPFATKILQDAVRELVLSLSVAIPSSDETFPRDAAGNWLYLLTALIERGISHNAEAAKRALMAKDVDTVAKHITLVADVFESAPIIAVWISKLSVAVTALKLPPNMRSDFINNIILRASIMPDRYVMPKMESVTPAP